MFRNFRERLFFILNIIFFAFFFLYDLYLIIPISFFLIFLLIEGNLKFISLYLKKMPPLILLIPFSLINFEFIRDSISRSYVLFLPAIYFFVLYYIENKNKKIKKPEVKIAIFLTFVFSMSIFSFLGKIGFSGDEPHYLVVANSILYDQDLNIANNQSRNKISNFWYSEKALPYHGYFGIKGRNYIYSFHLPAISFMILPFFILAEIVKTKVFYFIIIRLGIAFWAIMLAVQFFTFLRFSKIDEKDAFYITILSFLLTPYLFFSVHLYPVIFLSFLMLLAINNFYFEKKNYLIVSISMSVLVWAGVKAILIILTLLFILLIKEKLKIFEGRKVLSFIPLFVSLILFFLYIYNSYGTFSLLAIYNGVLTPEKKKYLIHLIFSFKEIPLYLRIDSFFNYFFDQRDGLLFYFPVFLFIFPSFFIFFRKKYKKYWLLSIPFFVHLFNYAFNTHRGGYCPPARPISSFIWFLVFIIFLYLKENWNDLNKRIFAILSSCSLFLGFTLLRFPLLMYQTTTHEVKTRASALFSFLRNSFFDLPSFFPSFLKIKNYSYKPNLVWLMLILILTYLLLKRREKIVFYFLGIVMIAFVIIYLIFPFFSTKKYHKNFRIGNNIIVIKAMGSINQNENNEIEIFAVGEKFLPVFSKRKREIVLIIKSNINQKLVIKFDIRTVFKGILKKKEVKEIRINRKYTKRSIYFYPFFFKIKNLENFDRKKPSVVLIFK